jgi:hypothetical protein
LHDGVDLYRVPSMQLIRTYSHGNENNFMFKVSIIDKRWLVSKEQDGLACLYNLKSGQLSQKLQHGSGQYFVNLNALYKSDVMSRGNSANCNSE